MQILASALPGFRDLRAPLTAGYLWLIFLWIVITPDLATRPANEIAGSMYDLGRHVGPIWLGLGVSVSAYLVGAVSQSLTPLLSKIATSIYRLAYLRTTMAGYSGSYKQVSDVIDPYEKRALAKIIEPPDSASQKSRELWREERDRVRDKLSASRRALGMELDLPATLLLGKERNLFNEADRLKAESQLRFSVIPPLVAMAAYLSADQSLLYMAALTPVAILWWQGFSKELEFRSLMISAFQQGAIRSNTIEDLKSWVDNMSTLRFGSLTSSAFNNSVQPQGSEISGA